MLDDTRAPDRIRNILLADDDESVRDSIAGIIRTLPQCDVTPVTSGDAALGMLAQRPYDIFVTDMIMPGTHGLALVEQIRDVRPDVGIIVMTGFAEDFPYVDVVEAGAEDFISKPFRSGEVIAKLMRLIRERDLRAGLRKAEKRYRALFEHSVGGNLVLRQDTYDVVDVNASFLVLSGLEREDLIGRNLFDLIHDSERDRFGRALDIFRTTRRGTLGDALFVNVNGQEMSVDVSISFIDASNEPVVYLTFNDVTEKRRLEHQLTEIANTDVVTGLANRRAMYAKLDAALSRARRDGVSISLMFIDLDNFKQCNDTHGHQAGDRLLRAAGDIIRNTIRAGDAAFRYGGDEFAVLLVGSGKDGVKKVADRIRTEFEKTQSYGTTMSIGIAQCDDGMRSKALIDLADNALYKAKAAGKNGIHMV